MSWKERIRTGLDQAALRLGVRQATPEVVRLSKPEMEWREIPGGYSNRRTWATTTGINICRWMHTTLAELGHNPKDINWYPGTIEYLDGFHMGAFVEKGMIQVFDQPSGSLEEAEAAAEQYLKKLCATTTEQEYKALRWGGHRYALAY